MTTNMGNKLYLLVSGAVFFLVAIFHLLMPPYHWPVVVGTWTIPFPLSYVGFPVSSAYCIWACALYARARRAKTLRR